MRAHSNANSAPVTPAIIAAAASTSASRTAFAELAAVAAVAPLKAVRYSDRRLDRLVHHQPAVPSQTTVFDICDARRGNLITVDDCSGCNARCRTQTAILLFSRYSNSSRPDWRATAVSTSSASYTRVRRKHVVTSIHTDPHRQAHAYEQASRHVVQSQTDFRFFVGSPFPAFAK